MIADSEVRTRVLRWLVMHAAWQVDAGRLRQEQSRPSLLAGV